MSSSSSPCVFYQLQGSCSAGDQCKFLHGSHHAPSQPASNHSSSDFEDNPSRAERSDKQRVKQACIFWKQGRCKKNQQCSFAHTDTVQAEYRLFTQRSPSPHSASGDDDVLPNVAPQEEQPGENEKCIDDTGDTGEVIAHEDTKDQLLEQGDSLSTDTEQVAYGVSEKQVADTSTEALGLLEYEQDDVNKGSKQVESPDTELSVGDILDLRSDIPDEAATTRQTDPADNVVSICHQEGEGDRSLETVTPDDYVFEGGPATLETVSLTVEHDSQDEVVVQGQLDHDGKTVYQADVANDDDHSPHWTEYADPYANPFVAFCKFFAGGRCKQDVLCPYRHALTVQEYFLLFRVEPIIWSQYAPNEHSDPPLSAKHTTSEWPCKFYPLGKCRNGDKCPYTHDPDTIFDEDNHEELDPSRNENEQANWSSREQPPCRYFVNYGSCKKGEHCQFSHNANDINTDLVNNVESHLGTKNDLPSMEGRAPERGIDNGNTKDRPADEAEPTKLNEQNVDDNTWGEQWGDDNTAATQWTSDNAEETRWGDNNAEETRWGDNNAAVSERADYGESGSSWTGSRRSEQGGQIGKPCRYFALGTCHKAAACRYEHQRNDSVDNAEENRWGDNNSAVSERSDYGESGSSRTGSRRSEQGGQIGKPCRYFALGTCHKAAACRYEHQRNDSVHNGGENNGIHATQRNRSSNDQTVSEANNGWRDGNSETDRTFQANGHQVCWYFMQGGGCTRPNCKFSHEGKEFQNSDTDWNPSDSQPDPWDNPQSEERDPNAASWNDSWLETNFSSYATDAPPIRRREPCMFFGQGFCKMGTNCLMLHVNPDRLDEEEVQQEPEKHDQELSYDPNSQTERLIFNCTVAFSAGCRVSHALTATDPTQIILSGLPPAFSAEELNNINIEGLHLVQLDESGDMTTAILEFESPQNTLRSVHRLHGYALRNSTLSARLEHPVESERGSQPYAVMITWPAPNKIAWARYPSVTLAKEEAGRLDGQMIDGRTIQASYTPAKKGQKSMFAVQISNLPPESSSDSIKQVCNGCQFVNMTKPTYTTSPIQHIEESLRTHGNLLDFDAPDLPLSEESLLAFARFNRSEEAAAAISTFNKLKDDSLGAEGSFQAQAVNHVRLKIPSNQFQYSIQEDLETLRVSYQQQCTVFFSRSTINVDNVDIYAYAPVDESSTFMKLLASLNSIVNGETLMQDGNAVWDDYFHMPSSAKAIETANMEHLQQYNILVMPDRRTQHIIILGEVLNRPRAKDYILKLIKKVRVAWNEVPFERAFVRWYLEHGRDQIQSDSNIGQNKVALDVTVPKLIVRGDTKVLTKVKEYMHAAVTIPETPSDLPYDDICHICTQEVVSPITLVCKHRYCKECLTALLSFAAESHSMPLTCIATDVAAVRCSKDIPYSVIRDLLPMAVEEQLLRSRFLSHVRSNVKQLFFCPTPDCETVHRYRGGGASLHCPTCLNEVCMSCQTRIHPGVACREWLESINKSWRLQEGTEY